MLPINQIYNMDCLEGMKQLDDKSVDMILCDLPYGTTQNKWDSVIPFDLLWKQYNRILKPNKMIVLTGSQPFTSALISSNYKWFKYELIWEKNNATGFLDSNRKPLKSHENILIFSNGKHLYNPQLELNKPYKTTSKGLTNNYGKFQLKTTISNGFRFPKTILKFANSNLTEKDQFHPTQKPVALFEYLIRTYSNENDLVLDNCMGSGTTAVASIQSKRNFIGFEMNKEYYDKAVERINSYQIKEKLAIDQWF